MAPARNRFVALLLTVVLTTSATTALVRHAPTMVAPNLSDPSNSPGFTRRALLFGVSGTAGSSLAAGAAARRAGPSPLIDEARRNGLLRAYDTPEVAAAAEALASTLGPTPPLLLPPLQGPSWTRLILVRHGRTPSNRMGLVRGRRVDDSLDAVGRLQAARLGEYLSGTHVDAIFASSLGRARQTAQAVVDARVDARGGVIGGGGVLSSPLAVRPIAALDEVDFGLLEGRRDVFAKAEVAAVHAAWAGGLVGARYHGGGESKEEVWSRSAAALETLVAAARGGVVVACTHGDLLADALLPIVLDDPKGVVGTSKAEGTKGGDASGRTLGVGSVATLHPRELPAAVLGDLHNTCVNVVDVCWTGEHANRMVRINDVSHLALPALPKGDVRGESAFYV